MAKTLKAGDLVQFEFPLRYFSPRAGNWRLQKNCTKIMLPGVRNSVIWTDGDKVLLPAADLQGHVAEILNPAGFLIYIPAMNMYTAGIAYLVPVYES